MKNPEAAAVTSNAEENWGRLDRPAQFGCAIGVHVSACSVYGGSAMRTNTLVLLIAAAIVGGSSIATAHGVGGGGGKGGSGMSHGHFGHHFFRNHFLRNQALLGG